MIVTLYSGHLQGDSPLPSGVTAPGATDRACMLVYEGDFNSMDGPVSITAAQLQKLAANHNARLDRLSVSMGGSDAAMKDLPPVQLDHSTLASNTIGRVVGKLSVAPAMIEGVERLALYGAIRFLGAENVEKARDGRFTHVSIGADLEAGVLQELSVTPFPAAPKASLLTRGSTPMPMPEEMKKRCRKYLTEEKKLSEEDADKKLAALSDEDAKKLSEEVDDDDKKKKLAADDEEMKKKLAAEEEEKKKDLARASDDDDTDDAEKKEKKLAAKQAKLTKLMGSISDTVKLARLEAKRGEVAVKLSKFRADGLLTPAEQKNLAGVKLAEASDEALALVWTVLDKLEPKIISGQFGGVKGVDLSAVGGDVRKARTSSSEKVILSNMPFTAKMIAATKKANGEADDVALSSDPYDHNDPRKTPETVVPPSGDHEKQVEALQKQITLMSTQLEALTQLMAE